MSISKQRSESSKAGRSAAGDATQADKFRELARALDIDEDPAHFEDTLRKIAPKGPSSQTKADEE